MGVSEILPPGTVLQSRQYGGYVIDEALGRGGFGVTYRARSVAGIHVAIKEFFPKGMCSRDYSTNNIIIDDFDNLETVERLRDRFVKESQNIARCNHNNIVHIIETFEENGTAYMVMEHVEGTTLKQWVLQHGPMAESIASTIIETTAQALQYLHNCNVTHLDIKPDNIILRPNNQPVIIDFGMSRCYDESGTTDSQLIAAVSKGYTPIEQYRPKPKFSPESDVYSLAATYYFLITGNNPPEPAEDMEFSMPMPQTISKKTRTAILQAMKFSPSQRIQNMGTFLAKIRGHGATEEPRVSTQKTSSTGINLLLAFICAVCVFNVALYIGTGMRSNMLFHMDDMEFAGILAGSAALSLLGLVVRARAFKKTMLVLSSVIAAVALLNFHLGG